MRHVSLPYSPLVTHFQIFFKAEELCYVYQRIGFHCLNETLFQDAGKNLFNGDMDPRLLISYYPNLRGSLFTADDIMDVFAGVAEHMPTDHSVDDISKSFFRLLPLRPFLFRLILATFPLPPLTSCPSLPHCRTLTFLSWN